MPFFIVHSKTSKGPSTDRLTTVGNTPFATLDEAEVDLARVMGLHPEASADAGDWRIVEASDPRAALEEVIGQRLPPPRTDA